MMDDFADVSRLREINAEMLIALEPFASIADNYEGFAEGVVQVAVMLSELRRARAIIAKAKGDS